MFGRAGRCRSLSRRPTLAPTRGPCSSGKDSAGARRSRDLCANQCGLVRRRVSIRVPATKYTLAGQEQLAVAQQRAHQKRRHAVPSSQTFQNHGGRRERDVSARKVF